MAAGRFITLEGGEGAGKSTQARLLGERLSGLGLAVETTREPGGAPGAEAVRTLLVEGAVERWQPMSEALLMTAARVEHVASRIRPALAAGRWVICDRFVHSTLAYQGLVQGVGLEAVSALHALALDGLMPDLTLILDLPVEEGLSRAAGRGGAEDRYERMGPDFHRRLRSAYAELAQRDPARCRLIDATGTPEAVAERLWAQIVPLLEPA